MREEIEAAVHFFGRVIVASNSSIDNLAEFKCCLSKLLEERFQGHWHAEVPGKGQGYRSIRIHPSEPLDPVLERAASISDFNYNNFFIPMEFTLWVDPKDVSCRFGDLKSTYCTVLKNEDNKASVIDVDELLETAKAVYNRQQHISIQHNTNGSSKNALQPACVMDIYSYERLVPYPTSAPDMYAFHDSVVYPRPPSSYLMYGAGGDGFTTPPPPFPPPSPASPPHSQPQFQPSFLSSAVNTTPRKGKGGNFRKGGTGRTSRQHHHQNGDNSGSSNGGGTTYNHNHNNNHNTNGSTSNGSNNSSSSSNGSGAGPNWNGDRYHWVKGSKQPQHHSHHHHQQQHHHHQPSQHQQNSGSPSKEAK